MKSLLVDALRGAKGEPETQADESAPAAAATANDGEDCLTAGAENRPTVGAENDLSLIATGVIERKESEASSAQLELGAHAEESAAPQEVLHPEADAVSKRGAPALRRSLLSKIARLSPAICLLTMSVSAGAFVLYQNLAARHLNSDLSELSEHIGLDRADAAPAGVRHFGSALPVKKDVIPDLPARSTSLTGDGAPRVVALEPTYSPPTYLPATTEPQLISCAQPKTIDDIAYEIVSAAYIAFQDGDYAEAERNYREALVLAPRHLNALVGMAAVCQETGRPDEAADYYARILSVDPHNAAAAAALLDSDEDASSVATISKLKLLLQRFPDSAYLYYSLGVRYLEQQLWPEASRAFLKAFEADADNADYAYNVAVSMERLGDYESASAYFERAVSLADGNADFDPEAVREHLRQIAAARRDPS